MLIQRKFFYMFLLFGLFFLSASASVGHACYYTIVYLDTFMRFAVTFALLLCILASAEDTTFSRLTSTLLLIGIIPVSYLLNQFSTIEAIYLKTPLELFVYLSMFIILIVKRFYCKFYKKNSIVRFYTGSILAVLLVMYVSSSVVMLNYPAGFNPGLMNPGNTPDMYSMDKKMFTADVPVPDDFNYSGRTTSEVCNVDEFGFIFPFVPARVKDGNKYQLVPCESLVNLDRKRCTVICHNKTYAIITGNGTPVNASLQGLASRK